MSGPDENEPIDPTDALALRAELLAWYDHHRRDLPWRHTQDPYAIWVSEIMLQQTQVATVIDYWTRWLERFPTVEALAAAPLDDALEQWAGLGYYRRARMLHAGAQHVVEALGGEVPTTAAGLKALPGVGPYTAGAIASIAFGEAAPIVDGNVERILSRLFGVEGDPKARANQKTFWAMAAQLVCPTRPGDLNQAMMELGATVCTPKNVACLLCPVRHRCVAFAQGRVDELPGKVQRAAAKTDRVVSAIIWAPDADGHPHLLTVRRPDTGLLAGLLECPTVEQLPSGAAPRHALLELIASLVDAPLGLSSPDALALCGEVVHKFTHLHRTFVVYEGRLPAPAPVTDPRAAWTRADALADAAFSTAARKVYRLGEAQPPEDEASGG